MQIDLENLPTQSLGRPYCYLCLRSERTCYCEQLKEFPSDPKFVILMHPHEQRRAIASGRMAHRSLSNSELYVDIDFTNHTRINALINDKTNHCLLLHPSPPSIDISKPGQLDRIESNHRRTVVFVLDSTWREANKILRFSTNLNSLDRICFTPKKPSNYRIRLQPKPHCYATIESIHEVICLFNKSREGKHNQLIEIFNRTIDDQILIQSVSPTR